MSGRGDGHVTLASAATRRRAMTPPSNDFSHAQGGSGVMTYEAAARIDDYAAYRP